jgi:hypothetical protein
MELQMRIRLGTFAYMADRKANDLQLALQLAKEETLS